MFEHVKELYVVEDLHTNYWLKKPYLGNPNPEIPFPTNNQTFVEYSKKTIDWLHGYRYAMPPEYSYFRDNILSIEYFESIVFYHKRLVGKPIESQAGSYMIKIGAEKWHGNFYNWSSPDVLRVLETQYRNDDDDDS